MDGSGEGVIYKFNARLRSRFEERKTLCLVQNPPVRLDWIDPEVCSLEYRLKIIGCLTFFKHLPAEAISKINVLFHDYDVSTDQRIYFERDEAGHLYLVAMGGDEIEVDTRTRLEQALLFSRRTGARLVYAQLSPNWVKEAVKWGIEYIPLGCAVVLSEWGKFGKLPMVEWGQVTTL